MSEFMDDGWLQANGLKTEDFVSTTNENRVQGHHLEA